MKQTNYQTMPEAIHYCVRHLLDQPASSDLILETPTTEDQRLWPANRSPFPGLRAFEPTDALVFFGRGQETDALIKRVSTNRFVAVVGASGTGKSSLVGAGLIPRLLDNAIPGSKDWRWLCFTPGEYSDDPFVALAAQLAPLIPGSRPRDIATALQDDPDTIYEFCDQALGDRPEWAEMLLFVDQFEELFTIVRPECRTSFIELLAKLAISNHATSSEQEKTNRIRIVVTLRADFTHHCVEHPLLAQLLNSGTFMLAAPDRAALHEMIVRPATVARLTFEDDLAWRILDDTGTEPGALALMAYTLDELYQSRDIEAQSLLSHARYEELGSVQGAIETRAETIFAQLDDDARAMLSQVFRELVEVDERGTATRQRALLSHFENNEAAQMLLKTFTDARLLTMGGSGDEAVVEVAHDAIFRNWRRLAEWIEVTQNDLILLRQVRQAINVWQQNRKSEDFLWMGQQLKNARMMAKRLGLKLSQVETEFLRSEVEQLEEKLKDPALTTLLGL